MATKTNRTVEKIVKAIFWEELSAGSAPGIYFEDEYSGWLCLAQIEGNHCENYGYGLYGDVYCVNAYVFRAADGEDLEDIDFDSPDFGCKVADKDNVRVAAEWIERLFAEWIAKKEA